VNEAINKESMASVRDLKIPSNIVYESSGFLPSFPGLSGGAVLRCQLDPHNVGIKDVKL
jgi:hypothetical protein